MESFAKFYIFSLFLRNSCCLRVVTAVVDRWTMCMRAATEWFKCHWLMAFPSSFVVFHLQNARAKYICNAEVTSTPRQHDHMGCGCATTLWWNEWQLHQQRRADAPISKIKYVQLINCCIFIHQNVVELSSASQNRFICVELCVDCALWCEFQFVAFVSARTVFTMCIHQFIRCLSGHFQFCVCDFSCVFACVQHYYLCTRNKCNK